MGRLTSQTCQIDKRKCHYAAVFESDYCLCLRQKDPRAESQYLQQKRYKHPAENRIVRLLIRENRFHPHKQSLPYQYETTLHYPKWVEYQENIQVKPKNS